MKTLCKIGLCVILALGLAGCPQLIPDAAPETPALSPEATVVIRIRMPDYEHPAVYAASSLVGRGGRAVAPQTQQVALMLNYELGGVVSLTEPAGTETEIEASFGIPQGFYSSIGIELRNGEVTLTAGELHNVTIVQGQNNLAITCRPVNPIPLDEGLVAGQSVEADYMSFYSFPVEQARPVSLYVGVTAGQPDLYVYDPSGHVYAWRYYDGSSPVVYTAVFSVPEIAYAGVYAYGGVAASYSVEAVPWEVVVTGMSPETTPITGTCTFSGTYQGAAQTVRMEFDTEDVFTGILSPGTGTWSCEIDTSGWQDLTHLGQVIIDDGVGHQWAYFLVVDTENGNEPTGFSISGTISVDGTVAGQVTADTPLYVFAIPPGGGIPNAIVTLVSAAFPQAYTLQGLAEGQYNVQAFIDFVQVQNPAVIGNAFGQYGGTASIPVVLDTTDATGVDITLSMNEPNEPPIAQISGPGSANRGDMVTFDGSPSYDLDGTVKAYRWYFGDGPQTGWTENPSVDHAFYPDETQTFYVILEVTDDRGATNEATWPITVVVPGGTGEFWLQ